MYNKKEEMWFNEQVKEPAIIFSISTMRIIHVGDKSYISSYYEQMRSELINTSEEKREMNLIAAQSIGLTEEDIRETQLQLLNDLQYLEIPKDAELLSKLQTQHGLREYLKEIGLLVDMDDDGEIQRQIRTQLKH